MKINEHTTISLAMDDIGLEPGKLYKTLLEDLMDFGKGDFIPLGTILMFVEFEWTAYGMILLKFLGPSNKIISFYFDPKEDILSNYLIKIIKSG